MIEFLRNKVKSKLVYRRQLDINTGVKISLEKKRQIIIKVDKTKNL